MLFLLDAYALIYRAYFPHAKRPRLDSKGRDTSAIFGFVNSLGDLLSRFNPEMIAVVFDPPGGSFRNQEYEAYKANRDETPEAIRFGVPYIKQIIEAYGIPVLEVMGYEADDVIGTLAVKAEQAGLDVLMVTPDKDYAQLVTERIHMLRPEGGGDYAEWGISEVCQHFGLSDPKQMIDYLGMVGDSADNLPGIAGVGPKTASELLRRYSTLEGVMEHIHEQKGKLVEKLQIGQDAAFLTRRLATICTEVPIELELDRYQRRQPDVATLSALYTDLELRVAHDRLLRQYGQPTIVKQTQEQPIQDLFAEVVPLEVVDTSEKGEIPTTAEADKDTAVSITTPNYMILSDADSLRAWVNSHLGAGCYYLHTIATDTEPLTAQIVGIALRTESDDELAYIPIPQDEMFFTPLVETLRPLFEQKERCWVGHDLKRDLHHLHNLGIMLDGTLWDVMVAHYLLMPDMSHELPSLAERYLSYTLQEYDAMVHPQKAKHADLYAVEPCMLASYVCQRVHAVFYLKQMFTRQLTEREQEHLMTDLEMPLLPILISMERTGVRIDVEVLRQQSEAMNAQLIALEEEIHLLAGHPFNVNSTRQVGEVLFDKLKIADKVKKTKTGGYSTSEEELEKHRMKHPIVDKILEYRGLKKLLSTYINALPDMLGEDGRLHSTFNQTVAATGRLSSSNPNIQNIPIRTPKGRQIRAAFIPDPECVFLSADYSQIELRLMAHFSQDESLINAFRLEQDIHQATAAKMHGIAIEEVTADMRRSAKTANFGIIYGISAFGLAERLGISRSEAKTLIDGYFASYPGVDTYMKRVVKEARAHGYVSTLLGRRRYLSDINSSNAVLRGYAERNAINAPLQGTAADIIKIAMIRIDSEIRKRGLRSRMILQVHDELNFNVPSEELEELQSLVRSAMESALPSLSVPLSVGLGHGSSWLSAH